ncbi:MAG TPA: hypothetical protein VGL79_02795 [Solirubrobacteraceae bacterium]|jgi:hypothetical protein
MDSPITLYIVSARGLMLVNILFRLGYGLGALLAPAKMGKLRLAAHTAEHPEARLFVRGFGAHQVAVATLGLASRRWPKLEQSAAIAAVTIDAFDMISAIVEAGGRGKPDTDLTGGLVFSAAGIATAAGAAIPPPK